MNILAVMLGGSLGALARYLTNLWFTHSLSQTPLSGLPVATMVVNVIGSFCLSFLLFASPIVKLPAVTKLAIGTGFLGSFTTFSTFAVEEDMLIRQGQYVWAFVYLAGNLLLGFAAVLLGRWLALKVVGH